MNILLFLISIGQEYTATVQCLTNSCDDKFMIQIAKTHTRGSNTVDLLFWASDSQVTIVGVGDPLATSDQNSIGFKTGLKLKKPIDYTQKNKRATLRKITVHFNNHISVACECP